MLINAAPLIKLRIKFCQDNYRQNDRYLVWFGGMVLFWAKTQCQSMQPVMNEQGEQQ